MQLHIPVAYILLWIMEGDEHKLPFSTRYGLMESAAMQFETTNAATDCQGYINNPIREALDDIASTYLDNTLICSDSEEEHEQHVKWVMQHLLQAGHYMKPEKCKFHNKTIRYLGLIKSMTEISMYVVNIERVRNLSHDNKSKNGRLNNQFEVA